MIQARDLKYLLCPDSYKEAASALQVAQAMERGLKRASSSAVCDLAPFADGGEGFVLAMLAGGGRQIECEVTGPLGSPVASFFGLLPDGKTAVIEMAAAAGLGMVPSGLRNPLVATTYGVGELILAALDSGARRIIIGIGGSATNDGGAGMAQALGAKLDDVLGRPVGFGGVELLNVNAIDVGAIDARLVETEIIAACDVENPLTGDNGASAVYGPQKGATPQDVEVLDRALGYFGDCIETVLGIDVKNLAGAGAAGGLGAGLVAFCGARLEPGVRIVSQALCLEERAAAADWVITGEGRTDSQTLMGKAVGGVLETARSVGTPCVVLSGSVDGDCRELYEKGATAVISVSDGPMGLDEAVQRSAQLVEQSAYALGCLLAASERSL